MTPNQFDAALRRAIEEDERSARQLAIAAGVTEPSICHYRKKTRSLTWTTATRLLAELGFKLVPK